MHPVNYLFDEIMRHYWGIQRQPERPSRKEQEFPGWRLQKFRRENAIR